MLFSSPFVSVPEFEARSGWYVQPEGLCRDDVCVPVPPSATRDSQIDLRVVANALSMPLVQDEQAAVLALGPAAGKSVLPSDARAPDLNLPEAATGQPFALHSLRGKKVLLLAWASW